MSSAIKREMGRYDSDYFNNFLKLMYTQNGSYATKWARLRVSRVLNLLGKINPNSLVLDLACGMGTFTVLLSKKTRIIGVDFSKEALNSAKRVIDQYGNRSNAELVRCDVQFLPFRDDAFTSIIAADIVEHLYQEMFLKNISECKRILDHKGVLVLYTPNPINLLSLDFYLARKNGSDSTHIDPKSPFFLLNTLHRDGFVVKKAYCLEKKLNICNFDMSPLLTKMAQMLWHIFFVLGGRTCILAMKP